MNILHRCSLGYFNVQCHECSNNARILIIWESTEQCFVNAEEILKEDGFFCYARHNEGDTLYVIYKKDDCVITLSYSLFEKATRLVEEHTYNLPPDPSTVRGERLTSPLLTQLELCYQKYDCGMAYLIRLGDGQFIVIDGGMGEEGETARLFELLKDQNVRGNKPEIAAWFFTHAHPDHYLGFVNFMQHYGKEVIVKSVVYNWPHPQKTKGFGDLKSFDETIHSMKDTTVITARSGQQYFYKDCQIDILFAPEDLYPSYIPNFNDSSLVFRMTLFGHKIMWLGDMQQQCSAYLEWKYMECEQELKSEIVQVAHHGYGGGSYMIYSMIDPEILLWPRPGNRYPDIEEWNCNRFFKDSKNVKSIYVSGLEEVVLDMTKLN